MTNTESPSALLERAAELIERRAAEALASKDTPIIDGNPPWTDWYLMFEPDEVAQPLVKWLRAAAAMYRAAERQCAGKPEAAVHARVGAADRAASDFAREVLEGEAS